MSKAKKHYVVWAGRKPGIYTTWDECKKQVDGYPGSKFKSFASLELAEAAFGRQPGRRSKRPGAVTGKQKKVSGNGGSPGFVMPGADIVIFSDGCCSKNPGGMIGSGISVYRNGVFVEAWYGLFAAIGTSNLSELNALDHALSIAQANDNGNARIAIFSDSKYSVKAISLWAAGWAKNGWKTRDNKDVKNQPIVESAFDRYKQVRDRVSIEHCAGHAGIEGNEIADRMALVATQRKELGMKQYRDFNSVGDILALTPDTLQ